MLDPAGAGTWALKINNTGTAPVILEGFTVRNAGWRGIFANTANVEIVDCRFEDLGSSTLAGGAIAATGGVSLRVSGSTFTGGEGQYAAHIYTSGGSLFIDDSRFSLGSATYGGSIFTSASTVELWNSSFSGNTATSHGGAAWFDYDSTVTAEGLTVEESISTAGYGGGFFIGYSSELILRASTLPGNEANPDIRGRRARPERPTSSSMKPSLPQPLSSTKARPARAR